MAQVKVGDTIKVHYTGKLTDGTVFDSSEGEMPLEFEVGAGNLITGFEQGVIGMKKDENKTISIKAEDAYGEVREELFFEIEKSQLPEDLKPETGMELISRQANGDEIMVTVTDVKPDSIIIDANHKLAGMDLIFDVKLVEIK
ncbi:MAG: peptidylprolyl isomerase [Bacteroidales bacterium]|nr:peptidylprolyl isomerase [Bacteroidales bacterium]